MGRSRRRATDGGLPRVAPARVVVALGSFIGEGVKGTGTLDAPAVQVWEFDGDKVVAVSIYTDSDEFPAVVTEQEAKQEKEEEREDDEEESDEAEDKGDEAKGKDERDDEEDKDGEEDGSS